MKNRFKVEECVTEKGARAWTVYELDNLPAFHQKLGLWSNRRAAKRYADKLERESGCQQ
jgi:hypothetical protein